MTLADVSDYIESIGLTEHVYMGKLPDKEEQSIGVYNSKHQYPYHTALGGPSQEGYGKKYITLLIHWNKSQRDTEKVAIALYETVRTARDIETQSEIIKFIQPLYDIQDVGTDSSGIYEMVIEAAVIYAKGD